MLELIDSVANLKKLASTTCRCNARKEHVTVVEVQEKNSWPTTCDPKKGIGRVQL